MPEKLLNACRQVLGDGLETSFHGWDHAESKVWKVIGRDQIAYLKQYHQPRKYQQEYEAYTRWLPLLKSMRTPDLLAHFEDSRTLLFSEVQGELVEEKERRGEDVRDLYRQAGAFLRELQTLPFVDEDELPLSEAVAQRTEAWTAGRAGGIVGAADVDWVRARVAETLPVLQDYRRVPCHRDYTARNWLVDEGKLYVIDFEHSRPDLWFLDIERLWSDVWWERPDLAEAFWEGYGRILSDEEAWLLERLAALNALSTIVWAREHNDAPFEARGRARLERLKAGQV